jgi:hypothetical protein
MKVGWEKLTFSSKIKIRKPNWVVGDTKYTTQNSPSFDKPEHIIQISSYSEWIENEQGEIPDHMWLILGNKEEKKYKTREYKLIFKDTKKSTINSYQAIKKIYILKGATFVTYVTGLMSVKKSG